MNPSRLTKAKLDEIYALICKPVTPRRVPGSATWPHSLICCVQEDSYLVPMFRLTIGALQKIDLLHDGWRKLVKRRINHLRKHRT